MLLNLRSTARRAVLIVCWIVTLLSVGCSEGQRYVGDDSLARESLRVALDSWKNGERPDGLSNRSPAITVADFEWNAGAKLVQFRLMPDESFDGSNLHASVELTVESQPQQMRLKMVTYTVSTAPAITVVRNVEE